MKTIFEHIDTIKDKPHHVRERVAFGVAGGVTAVVALVWFFAVVQTGTFAIAHSNFAESTGGGKASVAAVAPSEQGGFGIAGAAAAVPTTCAVPVHIEVVDQAKAPEAKRRSNQRPANDAKEKV